MKFYFVDDDRNIRNILKIIVTERGLGTVCGSSDNGNDALEDLPFVKPDIVIADLLMPEMDGISFVSKAREIWPDAVYVMLSQVSSKDMISSAYEAGVEFFIQKPINSVEVESVIRKVCEKLSMQRMVKKMQNIFMEDTFSNQAPLASSPSQEQEDLVTSTLRNILQKLGIIGDIGSKDIITVVKYMSEHHELARDITLNELCLQFSDNPKSMEQRIRRTAANGLVNLAHLGLEDYANEIFVEYSGTLYNFEQVRKEMDYIRGKSDKHGNVRIRQFLNALCAYCEDSVKN
ncbi:MAG: response regulator [Lachnospiraceae bacterium]